MFKRTVGAWEVGVGAKRHSPQPQTQDTSENASCVSWHEERKHLQSCGHELAPITARTCAAATGGGKFQVTPREKGSLHLVIYSFYSQKGPETSFSPDETETQGWQGMCPGSHMPGM